MMNKNRQRKIADNLGQGSVKSGLWKLAFPMIAGSLLQNLFSIVDLFFIGKLGYEEVAALSIAGAVLSVIIVIIIGISSGTTMLVAHFIGKKDYFNADKVLFQTVIVSVFCSLGMIIFSIFCIEPFLSVLSPTKEILVYASSYLKISFYWSIFIFVFIGLNQALRGSGDAVVPLKILLIVNAVNISLDPLLIFGISFFPKMGVAGSAVATVISRGIGVVFVLKHLLFGHSTLHFHARVFSVNFPIIGRMIKVGFFASIQALVRNISMLVLVYLISSFGPACLAAYGIVLRVRMLLMMVGFGMGSAGAVLMGQSMGADQPEKASEYGWQALKYFLYIVLPAAAIFLLFPSVIIKIFNSNPEVVEIGSTFMRFIAITLPFLAVSLILGYGINGTGDTRATAIITGAAQLGIRVPVAYLMSLVFRLGTIGIWFGFNLSDFAQGLVTLWYFRKGYWKKRYHKHREILEQGLAIET